MGTLNALIIQKTKTPGLIGDGNGLYLQVAKSGSRSWIFRFSKSGRARAMGIGSIELVSLAEARMKVLECKKMLLNGIDPIEHRKSSLQNVQLVRMKSKTFDDCAASYIQSHRASWKNLKHANQWTNTLKTYASPLIGKLPVGEVDTNLVMQVIEPIWHSKTETASRLRNRIELILSWATVRGLRAGDNPARWRGHLDSLLPKQSSIQSVNHFAALPWTDIPAFSEKLRQIESIPALALEFQILTATRPSETTHARWAEINFEEKVWTIPAGRMKAKRQHKVPLSPRALEILQHLKKFNEEDLIFRGQRTRRPLSNGAILSLLKKQMKYSITAHGFRSSFRDWASEATSFPREVAEMALAHSIRSETEAAYRRGDLLIKRRELMNSWARYFSSKASETGMLLSFSKTSSTTS